MCLLLQRFNEKGATMLLFIIDMLKSRDHSRVIFPKYVELFLYTGD